MTTQGWIAVSLMAVLGCATGATADEVTSKGTVLKGKITGFSSAGVTIEPEYGKGALAIKWEDVEDLKSEGGFQILYGDDLEADTAVQGFSDGKLLVGAAAASTTAIETATIHSALPIGPDGLSWRDVQQATIDTLGFLVGFETLRKKDPTRFTIGANYRYSTQKQKGENSTTIEDRAFGLLRGEYDLTERLYLFGSADATYDAIQKLSIRAIPKAGLGYMLWEEELEDAKTNFFSVEGGGAWVYENYFSPTGDKDYFAIAFGAALGYYLPYGAHFGWRIDYLPAVDDWANDYLVRNTLDLTMPLVDPISAKLTFLDEYDSTPAQDTQSNSLFLTFGLSVGW